MHKVITALHETLEEGWDQVKENLNVHGGTYPLDCYLFVT